jgi:hypothetical protein
MEEQDRSGALFSKLLEKGSLKQQVYRQTHQAFTSLKKEVQKLTEAWEEHSGGEAGLVAVEYADRGEFELELKFAGDVLLFVMHTNVFEIPREHPVMRTSYIREDKSRSYCGIIHIYNFLADSFKYNRMNDAGYLIGRIFVNRDQHYFIEGKREVGMLYQHFPTAILNQEAIRDLLISAMEYTIDFDLLTPPFDHVKEVSLREMRTALDNMQLRTAKRMGFRFQADKDNG